ncbi:MAG TPA: MFS transporter [Anaerolineaceae bacterium]|nr:MFS transporter [Anaerolineaceae bacterium]
MNPTTAADSIFKKVRRYPYLGLISLAFLAFIALGLPDQLLGIAWPSIRQDFSIPLDAVGMLVTAATAGYVASSFLSGPIVTRLGVGRVLAISCTMIGLVLFGYIVVPQWWMMVALGVFAGIGAGAIDAGLNTYVAAHFGERLMQWLHACYGIGVTIGPIIMTITLTATGKWRAGYIVVGIFQFILAACFAFTLKMWERKGKLQEESETKKLTDYRTPIFATLRLPRVWLSLLLFFLYCGAEASLGVWTYTFLTQARGIDTTAAGFWAGSYWAAFTVGRIVAGLYARRIGATRLVKGGLAGALLGVLLLLWNPFPAANLIAVAVIGLSIAPIFPALMSGTSQRVGVQHAANTIGIQMAFTSMGTAVITSLVGVLARRISVEVIPVCLLVVFGVLTVLYFLSTMKKSDGSANLVGEQTEEGENPG